MRRKFFVSWVAVACLTLAVSVVPAGAQQRRASGSARTKTTTTPANAFAALPLPASDGVMFVDMRRLLTEAVPRVLGGDATRLAGVNADIEEFKTRTGVDARAVERVAVGVRLTNPSPDVTKIDNIVVVARGAFDLNTIVTRLSAKGQHREEKFGGKTIHIFTLNEQMKMFGVMPRTRVSDLAVASLDAATLAIGEPVAVRATIDAGAGRAPLVSSQLVSLAQSSPAAIVGFGANLPASLLQKAQGIGDDNLDKAVASIRQIYGSVGTSASGIDTLTSLRTQTAADAAQLSTALTALKGLGAFAVMQMSGDKQRLAQHALDSLQINAQGNDVSLRLSLAQADVATLLRVL